MTASRKFLGKLKSARAYDGYIAGICPFHDDRHPSLMVYDDGWFRCLACNKAGPHRLLDQKLSGSSHQPPDLGLYKKRAPYFTYGDRDEWLMEAHLKLKRHPHLQWYWEVRGVEDMIDTALLGWHEGWNVFPIMNVDGHFEGYILRAGPQIEKDTGMRYMIPPNQLPMMYCPSWALLRNRSFIVIVFGMIDALALASLRYPVVTCTGNRTAFNPEWLQEHRKQTYIIPDKEEEVEGFQLAAELGWRGKVVRLQYPEGIKDPADFLWQDKRSNLEKLLASELP